MFSGGGGVAPHADLVAGGVVGRWEGYGLCWSEDARVLDVFFHEVFLSEFVYYGDWFFFDL